jgi:DNA-binding transcriptional LysR family regulator
MAEPDLADLDAFAAVARARSFRGAARLRGVSASALSEAVRRLEERAGVRLLNRTTRSVTATEAGQRLLERLGPALGEVAAALDAVNGFREGQGGGQGLVGTLRLNVPTIVAREVLPGIAGRFLARHPGVVLEVVAEDSFVDVLAGGFDAGIRYDESIARDMIAVPVGPRRQCYALAASPAYLATHGEPKHPRELLAHRCIRHRFANGHTLAWELERAGEVVRIRPEGPLMANSIEMELAAAVQGLGVIGCFGELLGPLLASGALRPVLREWWQSFPGPSLYYPSRRLMPAPLRAFVDVLHEPESRWDGVLA